MVKLTDEQLTEIKRLNAARTDGEWTVAKGGFGWQRNFYDTQDEQIDDPAFEDRDAQWIAACSWAVPALVAEVERLRALSALQDRALDVVRRFVWHDGTGADLQNLDYSTLLDEIEALKQGSK